MRLHLVGDVHAEFDRFERILRTIPATDLVVQLGDFGPPTNHPITYRFSRPFYYIRGNHDHHPAYVGLTEPTVMEHGGIFMPDGSVLEVDGHRLGFLGGGESVDRVFRTIGVDYFMEESLSVKDAFRLINKAPIDILLTHVPPMTTLQAMLDEYGMADLGSQFNASSKLVQRVWDELGEPRARVYSAHMHPDRPFVRGRSTVLPILHHFTTHL